MNNVVKQCVLAMNNLVLSTDPCTGCADAKMRLLSCMVLFFFFFFLSVKWEMQCGSERQFEVSIFAYSKKGRILYKYKKHISLAFEHVCLTTFETGFDKNRKIIPTLLFESMLNKNLTHKMRKQIFMIAGRDFFLMPLPINGYFSG